MKPSHRHPRQDGFTFAELAFSMLVLVITSAVLINQVTMSLQSTTVERDKQFAMSKAQAILAEMQSFVDKALPGDSGDLDSLDDGVVNKPTLTIARDGHGILLPPDDVLSGNGRTYGGWQWSRRITVQPFPGTKNRNVRYSTVRVYKRDGAGIEHVMAELSAVVNAPASAFPTTQVFDLYLLAIENIPGWWVFMDSIKPFVESTITDLETRNPGLEIRTHWITKAAFGRDPIYRPHFNEAVDSTTANSHAYYYPGKMPLGSASTYYYVPANVKAHIDIDGVETHGYDADTNPYPYSLCDYWNHAMRYPDELALWTARKDAIEQRELDIATALAGGTTPPAVLDDMSKEPTLRLLLEDLSTNPLKYKNALVINLHGELLPMPALRNYSDAARVPDDAFLTNLRVVTHPEQLHTLRDPAGTTTENAVFRVYAYKTPDGSAETILHYPIALEVVDMDLTDSTSPTQLKAGVELRNLPGGVTIGSGATATNAYPAAASWITPNWGFDAAKVAGDATLLANEMNYTAQYVTTEGLPHFTRILLYNTPCVAPKVGNSGVDATERSQLYRMDYVPAPCESTRDFSRNLACPTTTVYARNTARWRLAIAKTAFSAPWFVNTDGTSMTAAAANVDRVVTVRTRIWTGSHATPTGTMWPLADRWQPENLSTTYTWWTDSREDVPVTERSQFQGDPRHCPYKDLFKSDPDFPDGYNWYFDDLKITTSPTENSQTDYPALDTTKLADRWMGRMNVDVPRLFELLRKGLVKSNAVYTTLTGWSYYYLGIGNDIGYDSANGYPSSIPVDLTPHGGTGSGFLNTITSSRTFLREGGSGSGYWWSVPWLGELYPDSVYTSQWLANGNLTAGTSSGTFYQSPINTVFSGSTRQGYGVSMGAAHQNTSSEGCTSFFNVGTGASSTFHHTGSSGDGTLTTTGTELATNYNFRMPTTAPITRPFGVAANASGGVGTEFALNPYGGTGGERFTASLYKTYFSHSAGTGSGLVKLVDPAGTNAAYVVVNGFDRTVESGSTFIAKFAVLSLIHSFFEAGKTTNTLRIKQPARIEIKSPTDISELEDPTDIDIVLQSSWARWDGQPYATTGSYSESEGELRYVLTYSNDGGSTWRFIQDDSPATPGELPDNAHYIVADSTPGDETVVWSVPSASFPQGSYYLRVDCYRLGAQIHHSYHKTKLFLQR